MAGPVEILLVEDNPADLELALIALRSQKLADRIEVARDGEEVLDFIRCRGIYSDRSSQPQPRLILLDIRLPKVDGLEVLREIRSNAETRFVPVVMLTSSEQESDLLQSYELGANSYIQKPADFEQLRRILKHTVLYWTLLNEVP